MIKRLGFRQRLVVAVTAVTLVTLGGALVVVGAAVDASQTGQLDEALLAEAKEEAGEAAKLGGDHLDISDRPGPAPDDIGHLTKYGAIYDQEGNVLAETPTFHGRPPAFDTLGATLDKAFNLFLRREHVRAVVVAVPGHPGNTLLLAAPRFDLDRDAAFLNRAMLVAIIAATFWAAIVTFWVVRRLTRGHEAIAGVARQVADGDFSARIALAVSGPEMLPLARDVNRMIDQLASLLASQREFIAHAAHELRSPLTIVYGELSQALRRPRDAAAYRMAIEESLGSTKRLKVLAEDLLALARLDASTDWPNEEVSVLAILEDTARAVTAEATVNEVAVRVAGECRAISGRPKDLERLFRNLIENAIRHSPKGGVVTATLAEKEGAAVVTVTDEGGGVADLDRERIFEPFYRGSREALDDRSGAGLGLAIARKIASAHGGDVTLGPKRPQGGQFVVRLGPVG